MSIFYFYDTQYEQEIIHKFKIDLLYKPNEIR